MSKPVVADKAYAYLLLSHGFNPSTGEASNLKSNTQGSHKFEATRKLHETASRLSGGASLLADAIRTLTDVDAPKTRKTKAAIIIKKTIMPLMETAAIINHQAATVVSPIAKSGYVNQREQTRLKNEAKEDHPNMPSQLILANRYIKGSITQSKSSQVVTPRKNADRKMRNALPLPISPPPTPINGHTYGIGEFLHHHSNEGGGFISKAHSKPYTYVKAGQSTIYRMIKAHKDGRKFAFDEPWNKEGRTPLLNHAEVDVAAEALAQNLGEKSKKKLLNAILVNKEKQNGCLPDPHKKFNDTTLRNYTALLASRSNHLSLAGRTNPKTNARWTAERSLIGSMTLRISDSKCLLKKHNNNYFLMTNAEASLWGCYLFWDAVEYVWIRSGSATGVGGIKKRNQTHLSRAKSPENPDNSKLYDRYPSQLSIRSKYDHETHFEKLCVYIPLAFSGDVAGSAACLFGKDYRKEGLFFYTAEEERTISGTNFRGKVGAQKFMQMIAYLFELGYDLALSSSNNVSGSPGFEGCGLMQQQE